jgi:hypothetical protein
MPYQATIVISGISDLDTVCTRLFTSKTEAMTNASQMVIDTIEIYKAKSFYSLQIDVNIIKVKNE